MQKNSLGLILVLIASFSLSAFAQKLQGDKVSREELLQAKKAMAPAQIRVMILDDPAHKMVVGWNNYISPDQKTEIFYDTKDHGQDWKAYRNRMRPQASWVFRAMSNQFAVLENLDADTKYYFVIKNDAGVSNRYYFQTLPSDPNARISVIAGGDSRNNREVRRKANSLVAKLKPHFVMFGGDMTNRGQSYEWIGWMNDWSYTYGPDGRITPVAVARGNHERSNDIIELLFYTKKGVYYSFNVASDLLRVYTLNSESGIVGSQSSWLEHDLRENDSVWKFAQYHRPIRPHVASKKDQALSYRYWAPIFYEYGVNVVVESDAHTVKSTWPIRPDENGDKGFSRDDEHGTVYLGEGCWGAPLRRPNSPKAWTRDSGIFNQFNLIWVDRKNLEIRTVKVDNAHEVGSVSEDNRFSIPANLDVWTPANGAVIKLQAKESPFKKRNRNMIKPAKVKEAM